MKRLEELLSMAEDAGEVIAFDLDGTLAKYTGWQGMQHIGEPIKKMVDKAMAYHNVGKKVVIFTARVSVDRTANEKLIKKWLVDNKLPPWQITAIKSMKFAKIYDDRAVAVEINTGRILGGKG